MPNDVAFVGNHTLLNDYVSIGKGSKIWHFCNIYGTQEHPVVIGQNTQIGSHSEIKPGVSIGSNCRFQNGVFIPEGTSIDDFVFIGPHVTFTNDKYPDIEKTLKCTWKLSPVHVESYASLGAGVIVLPGVRIGRAAQIGSGSVVARNIEPYAVVAGNPARQIGDVHDNKYRERYAELIALINGGK